MSDTTHPIIEKLWQAEIKYNRYCSGHVFIGYRFSDARTDINRCNYKLNGKGDGWFRKIEGVANGYGLAINTVKITSRQPQLIGDFIAYKAVIQYTANDETPAEDKFWIFVQKQFDIEEVLEYIELTQHNWFP